MTQTQEFAILVVGSMAFFVFLLMERKMKRNVAEKCNMQGQVSRMTKDLTNSYSYIGEINRKLDILENIALSYPESSHMTQKKENDLYSSIMGAIKLFGKSDDFSLRFVRQSTFEIMKEIRSIPENTLNFSLRGRTVEVNYFESDEFIVTTSPRAIDDIFSYIVIKKKNSSHKVEDVEMMKALAAQALFLFMLLRHKRK